MVQKTQVMVDLYWKCYAYGDELKPHIEFLDGIMLSSTRDIAPSCVENVDELIERQEKSLTQLDSKRGIVMELIDKGKKILENPEKPKFLESHVKGIEVGWDETRQKAQERLKLLNDTKDAWIGYGENNESIASEFEVAEEEIKKIKKRYNLDDALSDLKKRQDLFNRSNDTINGLFLSNLKFRGDGLIVFSVSNPGILGVIEEFQALLGLLSRLIPANLDSLHVALEELGLLRVLQDLLAFVNQLHNDTSL